VTAVETAGAIFGTPEEALGATVVVRGVIYRKVNIFRNFSLLKNLNSIKIHFF
jgi:hypothetical protein